MSLIFADPMNDPALAKYIITKYNMNSILLYNFGSILNAGVRLDALYPQPNVMALLKASNFGEGDDELTLKFDTEYFNQIMTNQDSFTALMKFMTETQDETDIIIICNYNEPNFQPVVESLIKMIQERYGVIANVASVLEDMNGIENVPVEHITREGLANFITDCGRYSNIIKSPILTAKQLKDSIIEANLDAEAVMENRQDELAEQLSKQK